MNTPTLIVGEKGSGKTYKVIHEAKKRGDKIVLIGGHNDFESIDFLGMNVPHGDGLVWLDGKLSYAIRSAKTEKVTLIIDELLRIPTRSLNILLTALSPVGDEYYLSTSRILEVKDGVGIEEVLSCPRKNLTIVATTNLGDEYAIDDIDPALKERFIIVRKDNNLEEIKRILDDKLFDFAHGKKILAGLISLYNTTKEGKKNSMLNDFYSLRILSRIVDNSNTKEDILNNIILEKLQCVAIESDGTHNREQISTIDRIIEETKRLFFITEDDLKGTKKKSITNKFLETFETDGD